METIVRRESDRLDRTVDGFLEYSRSRRVEQSTEVDLNRAIEEVIESIGQRQDARDLTVTCQLEEESRVLGDADSLHQVIRNLVINAIEAGASQLKISSSQREDHVLLEISDDGAGMSAELQKKAFLPFVTTSAIGSSSTLNFLANESKNRTVTSSIASIKGPRARAT